jgi:predicted acyltransferase
MSATITPVPAVLTERRAPKTSAPATLRLASIDAYRGFVMLLMVAELMALSRVAKNFPDSAVWRVVGFNTEHVAWEGCSLHDLIQPSFSFLVGVAVPFSIASRIARGQSMLVMTLHALWRSAALVLLGVFLRSVGKPQTYWTFEDTLTQIGLGYTFLFLLGFCRPRAQWAALAVILVGYWAAFALYPTDSPDFTSHWAKNANAGWAFDKWFLNLFPREQPFTENRGGYLTLSFIPTLGTMILGLIAGGWLRNPWPAWKKVGWMLVAGAAGLAAGEALDRFGICPVVKRIWTPSWTLYSGGWCFLMLAGFYLVIDLCKLKGWAFPLVVVGMNSIAIYCLEHLIVGFIRGSFKTHLGPDVFEVFGDVYASVVSGAAALLVLWLICFWMYRRKIFLRI